MEITEQWLDLRINRYTDGNYEAYEALSDNRFETPSIISLEKWLKQEMGYLISQMQTAHRKEV